MIPLLLWRCPLCATNDALVHVSRPLRADRVHCRHCHAEWRVRRVPGDNFYLKLVIGQGGILLHTSTERSVTEWYDAMKRTLRLAPIHDPAVSLLPGEVLYLASGPAELLVEETDPLFSPTTGSPTVSRGFDLAQPRVDKREVKGKMVGPGRLFLTNQRLVWRGDGPPCSFPLDRTNSAYAFVDYGLTLLVELRLYTAHFLEESLLKWVTYVALVARQVEAETGHRIAGSHF